MPWKETSPGRFERALDPSEAFFRQLKALPCPPGRERLGLTSVAQFTTDLTLNEIPKALRQAWKELRYRFPLLGASLNVKEAVKVYEVPDDSSLESWLDETIIIEPEDADPETIIANYAASGLSKLHYLPGSSQIMIRTSHWRTDGVGLCMLTNHLFAALANPRKEEISFGDEGARLTPSVEEAAGICDVTEEKMQAVREKWTAFQAGGRSIALPTKPFSPAKRSYRNTHLFSESTTSAIVAACKKRGVSVTTAITAGLAATVRDQDDPEEPGMRMSYMPPYNLRRYLPEPYNGPAHPLSVMVVGDPIEIELLDFNDSIKQIAPLYTKDMSKVISLVGAWNKLHTELLSMPPPKPPATAPAPGPPPPPAAALPKPRATPSLNSLGVLDRYVSPVHQGGARRFEITDFWFMVDILGPGMLFYAWTFRGRLRLTQCYNEVSFEPEYVVMILEALKKRLLKELEVDDGAERANHFEGGLDGVAMR